MQNFNHYFSDKPFFSNKSGKAYFQLCTG